MPNAKSHHLNNLEQHILVAQDHQPREASYTTTYDDGTKGASVHVLYWERNADKPAVDGQAQTGGEVRSMPYDEWKKPTNPIYEAPAPGPILTFDALVGRDAVELTPEAQEALRLFGGVSAEGKVLAVEAWAT